VIVTTTGQAQCRFGPLTIEYDARVLRPRAWSFAQSAWAAELAAAAPDGALLELCAGAGQIGLAAAVLSGRDLGQVEADSIAADYARRNAEAAGWSARTEVRCAPMQSALSPDERFPLVLADPPYLPTAETSRWPEDPPSAIDGGADGLDLIRVCISIAAEHLAENGQVLLQVAGPAQADQVDEMLGGADLRRADIRVVDDARAVILAVPR
jgi:methylase of polypeptide subunit release factors